MAVIIGTDGRPYTNGKLIGEDAQGNPLVVNKFVTTHLVPLAICNLRDT